MIRNPRMGDPSGELSNAEMWMQKLAQTAKPQTQVMPNPQAGQPTAGQQFMQQGAMSLAKNVGAPAVAKSALGQKAAGALATNAATQAAGSAAASALPALGPLGMIGGALLGGLFNEGGQVDLQAMMQRMPPEVQQLVQGLISGQIPPEQAIQALVQMGIPQEQAVQMVQQVMQMAQQQQAGPMSQPGAEAAPTAEQAPFNRGGMVPVKKETVYRNEGGGIPIMGGEAMMVVEEVPSMAPVSKVKKKTKKIEGHNTIENEQEVHFDTKSVPPLSDMARKHFGI